MITELIEKLRKNGETVSVFESCTGGLVCSLITDIPGSSDVFKGGFVVYSEDAKEKTGGLDRSLIDEYGVYSHEVAGELAKAAQEKGQAELGIGVTGIAGPAGGSKENPVGTVYIQVNYQEQLAAGKFLFKGKRAKIKMQAAEKAIEMATALICS